jgi:hypothetical protein
MRKLVFVLVLFVTTIGNDAKAAAYAVDPFVGLTIVSVGCPIGCPTIFETQLYTFAPGDTVDFGKLTLGWSENFIGPFELVFPPALISSFGPIPLTDLQHLAIEPFLSCDRSSQDCSNFLPTAVSVFDLSFTLPDNARQIQLAWTGSVVNYVPSSVPEPSTWAMLLIGFAGIGFAGSRKSRNLMGPKHP